MVKIVKTLQKDGSYKLKVIAIDKEGNEITFQLGRMYINPKDLV